MTCCTIDGHVSDPAPKPGVPNPRGIWLLARLAVHDHYNRHLRIGVQQPLLGMDLNDVDRLEVSKIVLAMAHARHLMEYRVPANPVVYMRRGT